MPKKLNRILIEYDNTVYCDTHLGLELKWNGGLDSGIAFIDSLGKKVKLKYFNPNGRHATHLPKYIQEWNNATQLTHEYCVINKCSLYRGRIKFRQDIQLIFFVRTVCEDGDYDCYEKSNWNMRQEMISIW